MRNRKPVCTLAVRREGLEFQKGDWQSSGSGAKWVQAGWLSAGTAEVDWWDEGLGKDLGGALEAKCVQASHPAKLNSFFYVMQMEDSNSIQQK